MSSSRQPSLWKQGVIWGLVYGFIHLTMLTPLLVLTIWFASFPAVVLYVKTNRQIFGIAVGAFLLLGAWLAGGDALPWLLTALFFLIPAIAIGEAFRRRLPARKVFSVGIVSFLGLFLLAIVVGTLLGFDLNRAVAGMIRDALALLPESIRSTIEENAIADLIGLVIMMVPFYLLGSAFLLTALTYAISRRICIRGGIDLPGLKPIREWRLPRSFVWIYLIALLFELFIPPGDDSFLTAAVVNLVPIFMFAFAIQGLAFLVFIAYVKRKPWIPWLGLVIFLFVSPLFFSLLGVFDTAFPIRDRIRKS